MKILFILLVVLCSLLLIRLIVLKRQITSINKQLDFLYQKNSQVDITLERFDKNTEDLVRSINRLLKNYRQAGLQIEKNHALFKETITSLSHDLRTPLATANGYLQLLSQQDLSREQQEYVEIANERINALKMLLDQLFEFARIEANELKLNKKNIDINSTLREVLAMFYNHFEIKSEIPDINIPNEPIIVWADKEALSRIFSNIIYNALTHGDGNYQITSIVNEKYCTITISNKTSNLYKEDISNLFDRFYTTDKSRTKKTTGLGLTIARQLTLKMDGDITTHLKDDLFQIKLSFPINT